MPARPGNGARRKAGGVVGRVQVASSSKLQDE